jgi:hypothetical protein
MRLPPLPAYHSAKMELCAEIDRGEVVLARPKLDKDGHKKWHPPVSDRPTLTLYARVGKGEVALGRWPTTIGGWKTIEKSDGSMALKYKESVTGDAIWPEILATPTWHPATGIPTRKLLIKRGDTWEPKTEIIGRVTAQPTGWWRWCTIRPCQPSPKLITKPDVRWHAHVRCRQPMMAARILRRLSWSSACSVPSWRSTRLVSMVVTSGLMSEGLSKPASCQRRTAASPTVGAGRNWLVMAIRIRSGRSRWWTSELTTTAGRFLVVVWSVNGNGTTMTSPKW